MKQEPKFTFRSPFANKSLNIIHSHQDNKLGSSLDICDEIDSILSDMDEIHNKKSENSTENRKTKDFESKHQVPLKSKPDASINEKKDDNTETIKQYYEKYNLLSRSLSSNNSQENNMASLKGVIQGKDEIFNDSCRNKLNKPKIDCNIQCDAVENKDDTSIMRGRSKLSDLKTNTISLSEVSQKNDQRFIDLARNRSYNFKKDMSNSMCIFQNEETVSISINKNTPDDHCDVVESRGVIQSATDKLKKSIITPKSFLQNEDENFSIPSKNLQTKSENIVEDLSMSKLPDFSRLRKSLGNVTQMETKDPAKILHSNKNSKASIFDNMRETFSKLEEQFKQNVEKENKSNNKIEDLESNLEDMKKRIEILIIEKSNLIKKTISKVRVIERISNLEEKIKIYKKEIDAYQDIIDLLKEDNIIIKARYDNEIETLLMEKAGIVKTNVETLQNFKNKEDFFNKDGIEKDAHIQILKANITEIQSKNEYLIKESEGLQLTLNQISKENQFYENKCLEIEDKYKTFISKYDESELQKSNLSGDFKRLIEINNSLQNEINCLKNELNLKIKESENDNNQAIKLQQKEDELIKLFQENDTLNNDIIELNEKNKRILNQKYFEKLNHKNKNLNIKRKMIDFKRNIIELKECFQDFAKDKLKVLIESINEVYQKNYIKEITNEKKKYKTLEIELNSLKNANRKLKKRLKRENANEGSIVASDSDIWNALK